MGKPMTPEFDDEDLAPELGDEQPRRRRWWMVLVAALCAVLVAAATVGAIRWAAAHRPASTETHSSQGSLWTVTRQTLHSQQQVNGTLGYAGNWSVVDQASGTVTSLPAPGQVVSQGQSLYSVDGAPVVLLYGAVPAYRDLSLGSSGADVAQLNTDLAALGYASGTGLDPSSSYYGFATAAAVENLQRAVGEAPTGTLALGQAVFLPSAARVTAVSATLGAPAHPGSPVAQATSTTRDVTVPLNADLQSDVKAGDQVSITLPNGQTTPGVVSSVGSVATTPSGSGNSGSSQGTPTIEVDITPTNAGATGSLDQAPVLVSITTASVPDALVVPVNALLALPGGRYAVESVSPSGSHRLVPVSLGLFDDAQGLVQVRNTSLSVGDRIVVPST